MIKVSAQHGQTDVDWATSSVAEGAHRTIHFLEAELRDDASLAPRRRTGLEVTPQPDRPDRNPPHISKTPTRTENRR